jgi:hypothetical protein
MLFICRTIEYYDSLEFLDVLFVSYFIGYLQVENIAYIFLSFIQLAYCLKLSNQKVPCN